MTVARQGYVPGEAIVFNSEIDNKSDREMTCSKARLIMVSPFVRNLALLFLTRHEAEDQVMSASTNYSKKQG